MASGLRAFSRATMTIVARMGRATASDTESVMLKHQQQKYEMFLRVGDFGHKHQQEFPATSTAGAAFATVAEAAAIIERQSTGRLVSAQAGKKARAVARKALWHRLKAIVRTARKVGEDDPPARDVFRLPTRRSDQAILDVAKAFLAEGDLASARWVALGLPDTSMRDLGAEVQALAQAIDSRRQGKSGVAEARKAIAQAIDRGFEAVRQLDVIVANTHAPESALVAAWQHARRLAPAAQTAPKETRVSAAPLPATMPADAATTAGPSRREPLPKAS